MWIHWLILGHSFFLKQEGVATASSQQIEKSLKGYLRRKRDTSFGMNHIPPMAGETTSESQLCGCTFLNCSSDFGSRFFAEV